MNEILSRGYHKDPKTVRVNELPDHAYFIPFEGAAQCRAAREKSPYFHSLCGDWQFKWVPSVYELEDFYKADFDCRSFDKKYADHFHYRTPLFFITIPGKFGQNFTIFIYRLANKVVRFN